MRGLKARAGVELPATVPGAVWVPLTKGKFALVDAADAWVLQSPWSTHDAGYATRRENKKVIYMHRQILAAEDGLEVDHIDGDGLNNRRSNIRFATHQQNLQNQKARGGSSSFRGVAWDRHRAKWRASVRLGGVRWQRRFDSELEAAEAYNVKAAETFGAYARLNDLGVLR